MSAQDDEANKEDASLRLVDELNKLCGSDSLSIESLRDKIKDVSDDHAVDAIRKSRFFHRACFNDTVTLEIIQCLLDFYPEAATICIGGVYPLHLACVNGGCPNAVVKLVLEKNPSAAKQTAEIFTVGGELLPFQYYFARGVSPATMKLDIELDTVKLLLEAYPEALTKSSEGNHPIVSILRHSGIKDMMHIAKYLIDFKPSILDFTNRSGENILHLICSNRNATSAAVKLVMDYRPELVRQLCSCERYPLHSLCKNYSVSMVRHYPGGSWHIKDEEAVAILRLFLDAFPDAVRRRECDAYLPIHFAAENKSPEFCKLLIDAYPQSLRIQRGGGYGDIPIHLACEYGRLDTVKSLLEMDPDHLHRRTSMGMLLIHKAAGGQDAHQGEIVKFLMEKDPGCELKVVRGGDMYEGSLPLHMACINDFSLVAARTLYDARPETIFSKNAEGLLPFEILDKMARMFMDGPPNKEVRAFLKTQHEYALKANDEEAILTPDANGWLLLHDALNKGASLGTIKLLVKENPAALQVAGKKGEFPLHIACEFNSADVVAYLVDHFGGCLNDCDDNEDSALHYASRGGKLDTVKYLLGKTGLVSKQNAEKKLPIHLLFAPAAVPAVVAPEKVTVVATRTSKDCKVGIATEEVEGTVKIAYIKPGSLVAGTDLEVGMTVESINNEECDTVEKTMALIKADEGEVTIVAFADAPPPMTAEEADEAKVDRESPEYVDTILRLLLAHPETVATDESL